MNNPKILVVEDDSTVRNLITTTLKSNNYAYITAANGEAAIAAATTQQPDIVFLDLGLPDLDGVEVIQRIRSWSQMPIIAPTISGAVDMPTEASSTICPSA